MTAWGWALVAYAAAAVVVPILWAVCVPRWHARDLRRPITDAERARLLRLNAELERIFDRDECERIAAATRRHEAAMRAASRRIHPSRQAPDADNPWRNL